MREERPSRELGCSRRAPPVLSGSAVLLWSRAMQRQYEASRVPVQCYCLTAREKSHCVQACKLATTKSYHGVTRAVKRLRTRARPRRALMRGGLPVCASLAHAPDDLDGELHEEHEVEHETDPVEDHGDVRVEAAGWACEARQGEARWSGVECQVHTTRLWQQLPAV